MSMNPRETTEKIREDYQEYISSILTVKDTEITKLARQVVKSTGFVKGPYLETTLPFKQGNSLSDLAEEGLISKEFSHMGKNIHFKDWKLRIHQEDALRHIISKKRNMIVSTGTGSGKTECYLYPVFNEIMREKERGELDDGVRALLIFPMNALANDQQKKLRKLLKEYPDITFGRYTGETEHKYIKETAEDAEKRLHEEYDNHHRDDTDSELRKSISNEYMCREYMAKKPPHILLTNYAMLEYMLLRPDTAPFFDNSSAKNWRFIVIDEAHSYKGAQGTEIAYLLRRLKERIRHNMHNDFRCIATSATLGSEDAKADLAKFAESLFNEPFSAEDVITTKRDLRNKSDKCRSFSPDEYISIKEKANQLSGLEKEKFLYKALVNDSRLFAVYDALNNRPKRIEEVAQSVFPDLDSIKEQENALIDLIELSAGARKDETESALLPARYHLFVKSLEGMFVQYYPQKSVFLDRKEKQWSQGKNYSVFELANCQKCEQEYLVGKTIEIGNNNYFVQTSTIEKPEFYFISNAADEVNLSDYDEDDVVEEVEKTSGLGKYHLCLSCGRITDYKYSKDYKCCDCSDSKKIVTVYNLNYSGRDNESNCCPCCGSTKKGLIKRFLTANQPATFTIAKSLYDSIPPRPISIVKDDIDDIFDDIFEDDITESEVTVDSSVIDESGRKLLVFSDNRQEAAFFAGFFEKRYMLIMWRKIIIKCLKKVDSNKLVISDLISRAVREAEKYGLYSYDLVNDSNMTDDQKKTMAAHYIMQEFLNPDQVTGLERLGYISVKPESFPPLKDSFVLAGLKGNEVWNLITYIMDTLRQKGTINYPDEVRATDDFFAPRNHYGYFRQSESKSDRNGYIYGYLPQEGRYNKRLAVLAKLERMNGVSEEEVDFVAREDLKKTYDLIGRLIKNKYVIESNDSTTGTKYCLNYAKWSFNYIKDEDKLYKCNQCGKVYSYSIKDICPEMKCNGQLEKIKAKDVRKIPYYNSVYNNEKLIPMVAREHTAQLTSKAAGEYQKGFEEGRINVLSCSTTFEMGVDVGELEATFQRNVPPETSNYIQRAGRAGRRTSSAAFSVTFSRRTSHDMTFFQEPSMIIAGKIPAPILEIDNEKIAQRHLNSIVVSWFFKRHPEFFNNNTKEIVSYGKDKNMVTVLKRDLEEQPAELIETIHNVLPDKVCEKLDVDAWRFIDDIVGEGGSLTRAVEERASDIGGLRKFISDIIKENGDSNKSLKRAYPAEKLINTLEDESSINFLSAKCVLPKYGFPVDSVSLDIISGDDEEAKKIDLTRDLKMAISEFAPPAQVVANGKVWKSYAINTIPDKSWPTYIYHECPKCQRIYPPELPMTDIFADLNEAGVMQCKSCGRIMNARKFIIPIFGFSTAMNDKPSMVGDSRPSSYYSSQTQFWGIDDLTEKEKEEQLIDNIVIKGKTIGITYSPGGKLFVLNQGRGNRGLCVCPTCGFTVEPGTKLKGGRHNNKYDRPCFNKKLIPVSLGHEFSTDIIKIVLPEHKIKLENEETIETKHQYLSTLYAILEGACKALGISRDDINGCVTGDRELVLFDDTPGGSGYVKNIFQNFKEVLYAARDKVSGTCGCTEETSCYGCLRNYSNQYCHDSLSRGLAFKYLDWIIESEYTDDKLAEIKDTFSKKIRYDEDLELSKKKKSNYEGSRNNNLISNVTILGQLISENEDNKVVAEFYKRLLLILQDFKYENAIVDDYIPVEQSIWPDIFWGESRVALFTSERAFKMLNKYDWHCYLINESLDVQEVVKHIIIKE